MMKRNSHKVQRQFTSNKKFEKLPIVLPPYMNSEPKTHTISSFRDHFCPIELENKNVSTTNEIIVVQRRKYRQDKQIV